MAIHHNWIDLVMLCNWVRVPTFERGMNCQVKNEGVALSKPEQECNISMSEFW